MTSFEIAKELFELFNFLILKFLFLENHCIKNTSENSEGVIMVKVWLITNIEGVSSWVIVDIVTKTVISSRIIKQIFNGIFSLVFDPTISSSRLQATLSM